MNEYIAEYAVPQTPPWKLKTPFIIMDLSKAKKNETSPEEYKCLYNEILSKCNDYEAVYTDGSK